MSENHPAYSHHIFVLPFAAKGLESFPKSSNWKELSQDANELPYLNVEAGEKRERLKYAYRRYFNKEAEELIFRNPDLVTNYAYTGLEKGDVYRISYYNQINKLECYDLTLDYIMLRYLPNLKAGFLIFSMENRCKDKLEDIKNINQYGRHLYAPFLPALRSYSVSPNNIELIKSDKIKEEPRESDLLLSYGIMSAPKEILQDFFGLPEEAIFPEDISQFESKPHLEIIIDDRMYVMSYMMVPEVEDLIYKTANWANFDDSEQSLEEMKLLYSILYVDKGDSTCLSRDMLKTELEKLLYTRWSAEGSLYMASQHSMIFMSGSDFPEFFLKGYFLTEYLDLALITLSQRIGILKYSKDAGDKVNARVSDKLKLQKAYTTFKNQYLLPELCPQEQAVEIYELLQTSLYIEKHINLLDSQISELHGISQTEASNELNETVIVLTVLSITLAIIPNIKELQDNCLTICNLSLAYSSWLTLLILLSTICFFYFKKRK